MIGLIKDLVNYNSLVKTILISEKSLLSDHRGSRVGWLCPGEQDHGGRGQGSTPGGRAQVKIFQKN